MGAELLCDILWRLKRGETLPRTPQDDSQATYAPMLSKALCPIDWTKPRQVVYNQIRGLDPWPVAPAELAGTRVKIYQAEQIARTTDAVPGTVLGLSKTGLEVACGDGNVLSITMLQAEGGKRMAAPDYFRGHPLKR